MTTATYVGTGQRGRQAEDDEQAVCTVCQSPLGFYGCTAVVCHGLDID